MKTIPHRKCIMMRAAPHSNGNQCGVQRSVALYVVTRRNIATFECALAIHFLLEIVSSFSDEPNICTFQDFKPRLRRLSSIYFLNLNNKFLCEVSWPPLYS